MYLEWKNHTFFTRLEYVKKTYPTAEAIVYNDLRLTFNEYTTEIYKLVKAMKELGINKGDHVACVFTSIPQWSYLYWASAVLGSVLTPLNITWVGREMVQGLKMTDAKYLIMMDEFRTDHYIEKLLEQMPDLATQNKEELKLEKAPLLKKMIIYSATGKKYDFAYDYEELHATGSNFTLDEICEIGSAVKPKDDVFIMMTSGSTGVPKCAIHTHESVLACNSSMADTHELRCGDKFLHFCPTYHVAGTNNILFPQLRGATVVHADFFDTETMMRIIQKEKIDMMWGFDIMFLMMIRHPRFKHYDLNSMRGILIGNSVSTFDEIKTGLNIAHHGGIYGTTEYNGACSQYPWMDRFDLHHQKHSNGKILSYCQMKIVNPGTGEELPNGEMGEICFKGPGLARGYYKQEEVWNNVIDEEGYYHSGDWGSIDDEGHVFYRGRIQDTVKTGGENVSCKEVEVTMVTEIPWINTVQVFGVPDIKWGEMVTACVELVPGKECTEQELRNECKKIMAGYKVPKRIQFLKSNEWVVTLTGKFDKKAIRQRFMEKEGIEEGSVQNLL